METHSPEIKISTVELMNKDLHIVREDLLPGGTKQRAAVPFLKELIAEGYSEFVYSSPFCGFAQLALAHAARLLGCEVRLYCQTLPGSADQFHELSLECQRLGAKIFPCQSIAEGEEFAREYVAGSPKAFHVPLGFNHPLFIEHYGTAISEQLLALKKKLGFCPDTLWLPVGSGTLARLFREILPNGVALNCVDVGVLPKNDERIKAIHHLRNVTYFASEQAFEDESAETPPVPSNRYYDAKLWHFLERHASAGEVWWNVAR